MENLKNTRNPQKPTSSSFKAIYQNFMKIFDIESETELANYLSEINIPSKQVCAKILKRGKIIFYS
jgi:hypothetical protein